MFSLPLYCVDNMYHYISTDTKNTSTKLVSQHQYCHQLLVFWSHYIKLLQLISAMLLLLYHYYYGLITIYLVQNKLISIIKWPSKKDIFNCNICSLPSLLVHFSTLPSPCYRLNGYTKSVPRSV